MIKTKIVCTIGPASRKRGVLRQLIQAGMNVVRLNFSHGTHEEHKEVISIIRNLSRDLKQPVAILQDLQGPKIRIGKIASGTVQLESGAVFTLSGGNIPGDEKHVSISYPRLAEDVRPGDTLLLSDGALELKVLETSGRSIKCRVIVGGPLSSHKGINLPSCSIKAPSLTEKDKRDLAFGMEHKVDYVALSFVRKAADVLEARKFMEKRGSYIPLIAKIEKHEALANIDGIISLVDAVMVARGDLGVETPLENVPQVQKLLIHKANKNNKPVITATQMLRSMVDSPRPTRAEVTDVANAILDGTDAVMLSEETAVGQYPVEAVRMMAKIARDAETGFPYSDWIRHEDTGRETTLAEAVAYSACRLAENIHAAAIITFTHSGSTARLVSRYRPSCPIIAATPLPETCRRLALVWGVVPILSRGMKNTDEMIGSAFQAARESGLVAPKEKIVITAGVPVGIPGTTNLIKAEVLK